MVLIIAPWNYPLLTAVNGVAAALLAGNAVILKHSSLTPGVGEHFAKAFGRLEKPVPTGRSTTSCSGDRRAMPN